MQNTRCCLSEILNRDRHSWKPAFPGGNPFSVGYPNHNDSYRTLRGSTLLWTQKESLTLWVKFDESDQQINRTDINIDL